MVVGRQIDKQNGNMNGAQNGNTEWKYKNGIGLKNVTDNTNTERRWRKTQGR